MFRNGELSTEELANPFDLVIIGAGMAGITVATELISSGLRVCLIESGGFHPDRFSQTLADGESVGYPYYHLDRARHRVFGGSSVRWGGFCRPLDDCDFTTRSWIPFSGWPITAQALAEPYRRAAETLGLPDASFRLEDRRADLPPPPGQGDPEIEPAIIQYSSRYDFGIRALPRLGASQTVTVLIGSNVAGLLRDQPDGRHVDSVDVVGRGGGSFRVRARAFVLAAGGIENARLLLASGELGNETDWVGRCFMEHLHRSLGFIVPRRDVKLSGFFGATEVGDGVVQGTLSPTASAMAAYEAPSSSFSLATVPEMMRTAPLLSTPPTALAHYRRLRERRPALAGRLRQIGFATTGQLERARTALEARQSVGAGWRGAWTVYVRGEQVPNRDSRVTLSHKRDAFGNPLARLDWQLDERDLNGIRRWSHVLDGWLRRHDLGRLVSPHDGWEHSLRGGPHHLGTTRMSASPDLGVVDADCRLHSVDNVFVAGGSVFATSGHANPSFTILALAFRLAGHLDAELRRSAGRQLAVHAPLGMGSSPPTGVSRS